MIPAWCRRRSKVSLPPRILLKQHLETCSVCACSRVETRSVTCPAGDIKQEAGLYREGPSYQRRGSLQLWQFLVALLDDPSNSHFIAWTGRGMEFKLIEPEEVRQKTCLSFYEPETDNNNDNNLYL